MREFTSTCGGFTNSYYLYKDKIPTFYVSIERGTGFTELAIAPYNDHYHAQFPDEIEIEVSGVTSKPPKIIIGKSKIAAMYRVNGHPEKLTYYLGGFKFNSENIYIKPLEFKYENRHYLACVQ